MTITYRKFLFAVLTLTVSISLISNHYPMRWLFLKLVEQGLSTWPKLSNLNLEREYWLSFGFRKDAARSGRVKWRTISPGLEVAELNALVRGTIVDRIHLVRMDPDYFDFKTHVDANAYRDVDEWIDFTGAQVVTNGSYYDLSANPVAPIKSSGRLLGPSRYEADHGAFIVQDGKVWIQDLAGKSWEGEFAKAQEALVSYPLLLNESGESRAGGHDSWLANRTFIAQDIDDRIIFGTSARAFFSLRALAQFLKDSPLNLKIALNLDGGPVSSQAIRSGFYSKSIYGSWEIAGEPAEPTILTPGYKAKKWALPIVISATYKSYSTGVQ